MWRGNSRGGGRGFGDGGRGGGSWRGRGEGGRGRGDGRGQRGRGGGRGARGQGGQSRGGHNFYDGPALPALPRANQASGGTQYKSDFRKACTGEIDESLIIPFQQDGKAPTSEDLSIVRAPRNRDVVAKLFAEADVIPVMKKPAFSSGSGGKDCFLRVNYFKVDFEPDTNWHHYHVEFQPNGTKALKRQLFEIAKAQYHAEIGSHYPAFDYVANMFTFRPFAQDKMKIKVALPEEPKIFYEISIRKVAEINMYMIRRFYEDNVSQFPVETLQVLEIALRTRLAMKFSSDGNCFYSTINAYGLTDGLEIRRGFFHSIRPTEWKLMMNVDVAAACYYKDQSVMELICDILKVKYVRGPLRSDQMQLLESELKHVEITTTHLKRKYKILGLSMQPLKDLRFTKDDKEVYVVDYFMDKYGLKIQSFELPALVVRGQPKSHLPIELCRVAPNQRYIKSLTARNTKDMIRCTVLHPIKRLENLRRSFLEGNYEDDKNLTSPGIQIHTAPAVVPGRIIAPPTVKYHDTTEFPREGAWNMKGKKVYLGSELASWGVISVAEIDVPAIMKFFNLLVNVGGQHGVRMRPSPQVCRNCVDENMEECIVATCGEFSKLQILFIILPDVQAARYGRVKRIMDTEIGMISQCMQSSHVLRPSPRYCSNVVLKLNSKLGGINNTLDLPRPILLEPPTLLLGADVTHYDKAPSIAAVTASMDIYSAQYCAELHTQGARMEIITSLEEIVYNMLIRFYKRTKLKPARIIFYRDGISDGQFAEVLAVELTAIRRACLRLPPAGQYRPPMTFIIVQKRHHTRLFQDDKKFQDKSGNPQAGTIVDTGITHPRNFSFFLLSHSGIQGTSRPCYYTVLWDENNFTPSSLQEFTFQLCHLFQRCTRSVSMPPPAYYAHLAAFRARFHRVSHYNEEKQEMIHSMNHVKSRLLETMYFS